MSAPTLRGLTMESLQDRVDALERSRWGLMDSIDSLNRRLIAVEERPNPKARWEKVRCGNRACPCMKDPWKITDEDVEAADRAAILSSPFYDKAMRAALAAYRNRLRARLEPTKEAP